MVKVLSRQKLVGDFEESRCLFGSFEGCVFTIFSGVVYFTLFFLAAVFVVQSYFDADQIVNWMSLKQF